MSEHDPTGTDWTDTEIDLIVADYFEMLRLELASKPYVKAQHNAELQRLTNRSKGSIEFKHQNISAVLVRLGLPWIEGYKPKANFQGALIDRIGRYFAADEQRIDVAQSADLLTTNALSAGMSEDAILFVGAPPSVTAKDLLAPPTLARLIKRFDPAERDARNRSLGHRGEERVLLHERARLTQVDRPDLANRVRWVSMEEGDGAGYDILSFTQGGRERCLEVKTTVGHLTTPFFLSENERAFSQERPEAFRLLRLYDFARTPRAFELAPPLESHVVLNPTVYRASFEK